MIVTTTERAGAPTASAKQCTKTEHDYSYHTPTRLVDANGRSYFAGQTCIAPDYVLVAVQEVEDFVAAYTGEVAKLYPNIAANPDYTSIATTATTRGS